MAVRPILLEAQQYFDAGLSWWIRAIAPLVPAPLKPHLGAIRTTTFVSQDDPDQWHVAQHRPFEAPHWSPAKSDQLATADEVLIALAAGQYFITDIVLPFTSPTRLKSALELELHELSPIPVHDLVYDWSYTANPDKKQSDVTIAMARKSHCTSILTHHAHRSANVRLGIAQNPERNLAFELDHKPSALRPLAKQKFGLAAALFVGLILCLNSYAAWQSRHHIALREAQVEAAKSIKNANTDALPKALVQQAIQQTERNLALGDLIDVTAALNKAGLLGFRAKNLTITDSKITAAGALHAENLSALQASAQHLNWQVHTVVSKTNPKLVEATLSIALPEPKNGGADAD